MGWRCAGRRQPRFQWQGLAGSTGEALNRGPARHATFPPQRFRTYRYRHHHRRSQSVHAALGHHCRSEAQSEYGIDGGHLRRKREGHAEEVTGFQCQMLGCPMNDVKFTCQMTKLANEPLTKSAFGEWVIWSRGYLTTAFEIVHWTSQHLTLEGITA